MVNYSVISNIKDIIYDYIADTCICGSSTRERFGWFYLEAQDTKTAGVLRCINIQIQMIKLKIGYWGGGGNTNSPCFYMTLQYMSL